jgi:hypothetical protein
VTAGAGLMFISPRRFSFASGMHDKKITLQAPGFVLTPNAQNW